MDRPAPRKRRPSKTDKHFDKREGTLEDQRLLRAVKILPPEQRSLFDWDLNPFKVDSANPNPKCMSRGEVTCYAGPSGLGYSFKAWRCRNCVDCLREEIIGGILLHFFGCLRLDHGYDTSQSMLFWEAFPLSDDGLRIIGTDGTEQALKSRQRSYERTAKAKGLGFLLFRGYARDPHSLVGALSRGEELSLGRLAGNTERPYAVFISEFPVGSSGRAAGSSEDISQIPAMTAFRLLHVLCHENVAHLREGKDRKTTLVHFAGSWKRHEDKSETRTRNKITIKGLANSRETKNRIWAAQNSARDSDLISQFSERLALAFADDLSSSDRTQANDLLAQIELHQTTLKLQAFIEVAIQAKPNEDGLKRDWQAVQQFLQERAPQFSGLEVKFCDLVGNVAVTLMDP